jgi:hypothetical protein
MIRCKTVRKWLPLLDSDACNDDRRKCAELQAHLEQCRECREYQTEQQRVCEVVARSGEVLFAKEYLDDFTIRLTRRMATDSKPRSGIADWFRRLETHPLPTLAQAAAVVWLAFILVLQFPGAEPALRQVLGM